MQASAIEMKDIHTRAYNDTRSRKTSGSKLYEGGFLPRLAGKHGDGEEE